MSYAGPAGERTPKRAAPSRPATDDLNQETDWQQVAIFGAGLAVGIALGAGIAMLTAPQAGWKTRADITRFARNKRRALRRKGRDAWLDLRDELRGAATSIQRRRSANVPPQSPGALHPDIDDR